MTDSAPNIELRHLRYFKTAADCGSFRKAGAVLKVSESAISRRVRDLEDRLGASLFHRHSSGVTLTDAGSRYLVRAREILSQIDHSAHDVAAAGRVEIGQVKIGVFSSLASGFLAQLIRDFGDLHPGILIDIIDGSPADQVASIRRMQRDIAFVADTQVWDGCECFPLWTEQVYVALPDTHPLANETEIEWRQLTSEKFLVDSIGYGAHVRDLLVLRMNDLGRPPEIVRQGLGRDGLLSLASIGQGLVVTSQSATVASVPGITYRPIADEFLQFCAVWNPQNDNPAFRRFLGLAKEMARKAKLQA